MNTDLGPQAPSTLGIGDRYRIRRPGGPWREVTVCSVGNNVDGSFTVYHQRADDIRCARYTYGAAAVRVTYRAPRCPHAIGWEDCWRCADAEWPDEILTACFGQAPAVA
ncbi:hypothetical protein ACFWXO_31005 [Kitasatospora sp. NPDC059088]|uniref:hypothetical protein n=1 Tax=Kitasatospora sp. NPDC059088 TaxID=3346722 RepID=UPI00368F1338